MVLAKPCVRLSPGGWYSDQFFWQEEFDEGSEPYSQKLAPSSEFPCLFSPEGGRRGPLLQNKTQVLEAKGRIVLPKICEAYATWPGLDGAEAQLIWLVQRFRFTKKVLKNMKRGQLVLFCNGFWPYPCGERVGTLLAKDERLNCSPLCGVQDALLRSAPTKKPRGDDDLLPLEGEVGKPDARKEWKKKDCKTEQKRNRMKSNMQWFCEPSSFRNWFLYPARASRHQAQTSRPQTYEKL